MLTRISKGIAHKAGGKARLRFRFDVTLDKLENLPAAVKKCRVVLSRGSKLQMTEICDARGGERPARGAQRTRRAAQHAVRAVSARRRTAARCPRQTRGGPRRAPRGQTKQRQRPAARRPRSAPAFFTCPPTSTPRRRLPQNPKASRTSIRPSRWWLPCTRTPSPASRPRRAAGGLTTPRSELGLASGWARGRGAGSAPASRARQGRMG